jgi:hypothetical protein
MPLASLGGGSGRAGIEHIDAIHLHPNVGAAIVEDLIKKRISDQPQPAPKT